MKKISIPPPPTKNKKRHEGNTLRYFWVFGSIFFSMILHCLEVFYKCIFPIRKHIHTKCHSFYRYRKYHTYSILVLHGEKDAGHLEVLTSISIFDAPEKLLDHSDSRDPLRSIKSERLGEWPGNRYFLKLAK